MTNERRQYVKFSFYQIDPAWRRLTAAERESGKQAFLAVLERYARQMILRSYSLVGIRGDCDFLLWGVSEQLEVFPALHAELLKTGLGTYARLPYSYGLDDQEFVLAFETDQPADFLDLVMALRDTEASSYTERDTPIFSCIATPPAELLDQLG